MFTDTHVHLDLRHFDKDREEVIQRALDAGVGRMINVGFDVRSSDASVKLAENHDFIYATIGIHPHEADKWDDSVANKFFEQAKHEKVVALGEIGLDYYRMLKPEELQKKAFREQLELAKEVDLPVVIHIRDAYMDSYDILVESGVERVVLHCFSGDLNFAEKAWDRGWITAFGGPVTYPKNDELREVVYEAPSKQFFFETDCPYLPPQKFRGGRNEPAYVIDIAREIEAIREEQVEEIVEKNVVNLFSGLTK